LTTADFPTDHLTESMVAAEEASRLDGALIVVPLEKGDPLLWQELDDPSHPRNVLACMSTVHEAVRVARAEGPKPVDAERATTPIRGEIVVAARDIAPGEPVTPDLVTHVPVRSEITQSAVPANSLTFILSQQSYLPLVKGDVLQWSFFEVPNDAATFKACMAAFPLTPSPVRDQIAAARDRVLHRRPAGTQVSAPAH
jgi:flagella basal body P-ring formation protein FlgA